jgi:hypothetical protein
MLRAEQALGHRVLDLDDHVRVVADPHELVLAGDADPRAQRELVARSILVEDDHRDALCGGHRRVGLAWQLADSPSPDGDEDSSFLRISPCDSDEDSSLLLA